MGKIIKLTESDLEKIIMNVLSEQQSTPPIMTRNQATSDYLGKGGQFERSLPKQTKLPIEYYDFKCIPHNLIPFASYVKRNKKKLMSELGVDENTLLIMAKAAIGIVGRETLFRKFSERNDDVAEFLHSWGLGFIPRGIVGGINLVNKVRGKEERQMSLGAAQFTEKTWNEYGLDKKVGDYGNTFDSLNQTIGALYRINDDYKLALKTGNGTGPSVNPIAQKQGKITNILSTGNNAMDLAITAHNMPGLINKWCQTNDPNYAGPCNLKIYQPFPKSKPEIKLTVAQDKPIVNYFPNKGSGEQKSIAYLEKVVNYMNGFKCFSL
jgi:hypothetical protein